ncbi:pancreas/duodenum homeobox protein 1 [Desulfococcus sp.]|uniref:pancreas/duodenum homeobox protein 1 n=1 Tax=Desulfococcus sp. TaxID=2025834 RepID=UPI003593FA56
MPQINFEQIFSSDHLSAIFPNHRADDFFEALFGDTEDGAYDIALAFKKAASNELTFEFRLKRRPGKCLACNLTYGLPQVFSRHPVIDIGGIVNKVDHLLNGQAQCGEWRLGSTQEISRDLHVIPLVIAFRNHRNTPGGTAP